MGPYERSGADVNEKQVMSGPNHREQGRIAEKAGWRVTSLVEET